MPTNQVIPDFIVVGAMRAGTTTLYELLRACGQVALPAMKETDYFMTPEHFGRGPEWLRKRYSRTDLPVGDISPNYFKRDLFPGVARRIYETNPDAKIIIMVRDPIQRAMSQYKHMLAMRARTDAVFDPASHDGKHIIDVSRYAYQLEPYLEYWSMDDILIVDFDHLVEQPIEVLDETLKFIGLKPDYQISQDVNANGGDAVASLPSWWGTIRDSKFGKAVRARAPRSMIDLAKRTASNKRPAAGVGRPANPDQVLEDIRSGVREDAKRFRELTGRPFKQWSV